MSQRPPKTQVLAILPFEEPAEVLNRWRKKFPELEFTWRLLNYGTTTWDEVDTLPPDIFKDAEILCTLSALPAPSQAPRLKWIQLLPAGVDHLLQQSIFTQTDVCVTTTSGIHAPQIAEWVILNILAMSHHYRLMVSWQSQGHWGTHRELHEKCGPSSDWTGKRVGILGYGSIGRQTARLCDALGMEIFAFTASPRDTPESRHDEAFLVPGTGDSKGLLPSAWFSGLDKLSLHHFLRQDLDVLVVTIPLTAQTQQLIGEEEFRILGLPRADGSRSGTLLVNVSRGQILDQEALLAALKTPVGEGGLKAAALDVTDPEPLPKYHELWSLPNVTIAPHVSGVSSRGRERFLQVLESNLERWQEGRDLVNVVSRKRGY